MNMSLLNLSDIQTLVECLMFLDAQEFTSINVSVILDAADAAMAQKVADVR